MNNEKKRSDSESIKKAIIISSIMLVVIVGLFAGIIGIKSYNSKEGCKGRYNWNRYFSWKY